MQKNVAGQTWAVYAYDTANDTGKTGDAANITAQLRKDGGALANTNDTNPTEIGGGIYEFVMTQAETNADELTLVVTSSTSDIEVVGTPPRIYTRPANFPDLDIAADGAIETVETVESVTNLGSSALTDVVSEIDSNSTQLAAILAAQQNSSSGDGPLTVTVTVNDGTSLTVTGATWTGGVATITTSTSHGLSIGTRVTVASVTPTGFNTTAIITTVPSATTFTVAITGDPGTYSSGGTVTVPLQGVSVRYFETSTNFYDATTNSSGGVSLGVTAATYAVILGKDGYDFTPDEHAVGGNDSATYSMTLYVPTPQSEPFTTGYYDTIIDEDGDLESASITIYCTAPSTTAGIAMDATPVTKTPDGNGRAEFKLVRGATYRVSRGTGKSVEFTAPDADSFAINSVLGVDA